VDQTATPATEIVVDDDKCIGSGACVLASPTVFDQNDEGIVVVLRPRPEAHEMDSVKAAVRACPASVIALTGQ
jgi:ferredoxin